MKISLTVSDPSKIEADLMVVFVGKDWLKEVESIGKGAARSIIDVAKLEMFSGKRGEIVSLDIIEAKTKRIVLFGTSDERKIESIYELQNFFGDAVRKTQKKGRKKIAIVVNPNLFENFKVEVISSSIVEGAILSTYTYDKYKSKKDSSSKIEELLIYTKPSNLAKFEVGVNKAQIYAKGTILARNLVNEPPTVVDPAYLAKNALEIAKNNKSVTVTIFERDEIKKLGMNSVLGVAQGSDSPPKFIKLVYKPKNVTEKKIVLVGKGITFDTGGLSLKPASSMETMKMDMAGAAAVLGVFSVIEKIRPSLNVVGLIAACENMPSGKALRPGDILTAMNGKTIEVLNTDAEGRLTLADVLSYAVIKEKPDAIVDLATLTGAMMVALGEDITGLFSNNNSLLNNVWKSAGEAGEYVWKMPMPIEYKKLIKSQIADVRNISTTRYGGAITAALFLEEFVEKTPWAHLDIAGPAFCEKPFGQFTYGGTGCGVRLLLKLLENF